MSIELCIFMFPTLSFRTHSLSELWPRTRISGDILLRNVWGGKKTGHFAVSVDLAACHLRDCAAMCRLLLRGLELSHSSAEGKREAISPFCSSVTYS
jgi:hypothetical protein